MAFAGTVPARNSRQKPLSKIVITAESVFKSLKSLSMKFRTSANAADCVLPYGSAIPAAMDTGIGARHDSWRIAIEHDLRCYQEKIEPK